MHKSKNIVHINTKAKRSQASCLQEVWPFYSLTSVKDGNILFTKKHYFYPGCQQKHNVFEIQMRATGGRIVKSYRILTVFALDTSP